jgi:hypothetical protein
MRYIGMLPFAGQSVGKPIRLAGSVAKDLSKTETFEPPRGPRAQVSLVIVAINDHRPVAVERGRRPAVQFFQRDVDRAGQPLFFILFGGQRLDELRADGRHCHHFFSIDLCGHLFPAKISVSFMKRTYWTYSPNGTESHRGRDGETAAPLFLHIFISLPLSTSVTAVALWLI